MIIDERKLQLLASRALSADTMERLFDYENIVCLSIVGNRYKIMDTETGIIYTLTTK